MKGSDEVIKFLNEVLTAELTAINQYFIHSKILAGWGFTRLAAKLHEESIDEMKDADRLIERILYLGGIPNLQRLGSVAVGQTVPEQFELDLEVERAAIERYNRGIALCTEAGDNGTRELLERHLLGEERHAAWIETQLELVEHVGLEKYLAEQIHA